jgi:hypothetical protein
MPAAGLSSDRRLVYKGGRGPAASCNSDAYMAPRHRTASIDLAARTVFAAALLSVTGEPWKYDLNCARDLVYMIVKCLRCQKGNIQAQDTVAQSPRNTSSIAVL